MRVYFELKLRYKYFSLELHEIYMYRYLIHAKLKFQLSILDGFIFIEPNYLF